MSSSARSLPTPGDVREARRPELEGLARRLGVHAPSHIDMTSLRQEVLARLAAARQKVTR